MGIRTWKLRAAWAAFVAAGLAAAAGPVAARVTICETEAKKSPRDFLPARFSWDDSTRVAKLTDRFTPGEFPGTATRISKDGSRERVNLVFDVPEAKFGFSTLELLVAGPLNGETLWYVMGVGFKGKGAERVLDGFLQDGSPRATCLSQ
ncbi:hypothetical protein [Variovorax sp. KK3]|uniref:hypothetical protein n=1 Tax=Variovorax sp. KK3 TaxID=1855728 RepID=UPI00097BCECF|nr:hypothetical protein [Variovorax sp. KK3]